MHNSSFVTHVDCTVCGDRRTLDRALTICERCGGMLAMRYDLDAVRHNIDKPTLASRAPGMYRFRELTPITKEETPIALGEGGTPMLSLPRLAAHLGMDALFAKDEGQNPTGTFKARGIGMAVSGACRFGAKGFIIPSAGNAGGAAGVYGARAGLPVVVIVPRGTPPAAVAEAAIAGAHVFAVEGSISDAGKVAGRLSAQLGPLGWTDLSTLKEPFRLEGKKTMGLEIAEQLGWTAPEVLIYPTGGGTGLLGIVKAYEELGAMGWISGTPRAPRMISVQAEGCAPVVKAWKESRETTEAWPNPTTFAAGLRVPSPFAGRQMIRAIRETGGGAIAVSEEAIAKAQLLLARLEGIWTSPEAAATVAALIALKAENAVKSSDRTVVVLTGAGFKNDPPSLPPPIDLPSDLDRAAAKIREAIGA
jgi:threonine synthase